MPRTVDTGRTIGGAVIPAGAVGEFADGPVRFTPGCLEWGTSPMVLLDREHQPRDTIGLPQSLEWTEAGDLVGSWAVLPGPARDRAVADIVAGRRSFLSPLVVDIVAVRDDDGAWLVTAGKLRRVSLVVVPAFADAGAYVSED